MLGTNPDSLARVRDAQDVQDLRDQWTKHGQPIAFGHQREQSQSRSALFWPVTISNVDLRASAAIGAAPRPSVAATLPAPIIVIYILFFSLMGRSATHHRSAAPQTPINAAIRIH
jgi:hypothetical protein